MANLKLSKSLQVFMDLAAIQKPNYLGEYLHVSIREQFTHFQSIVLYPGQDYRFLVNNLIAFVQRLADVCGLNVVVIVENGLPVIEITDYFYFKS